jgi:hypothetical protein
MNVESEKYTGLETDSNPGPLQSIEGFIICITGLNEEVLSKN